MEIDALQPRLVSVSTGVRLEYVEQGRQDGVPVVLLHGVTDSWRSFELLLRHLPPSIRAFAISQRGHGESSRPDAGYRYSDFSEDVRAFMDAMGIRRAAVVGHSMGTLIAQRLMLDHPTRVTGAVLIGAFATLHADPDMEHFVASTIRPLTDPIAPAFARDWQLSTLARPTEPAFLDTVVRETLKVPARVWHQTFEAFLTTPDVTRELAAVGVPVLLIWGDRDEYAKRKNQDALMQAFHSARLITDEGGGHAVHWEDPVKVAGAITRFVNSESLDVAM